MGGIQYLDETDPDVVQDIAKRKEFQLQQSNEATTELIPRFLIHEAVKKGDYLELRSYQMFVMNYINPNTKYSRLLIKWETGIGKTAGALSIALNFIAYYQKQEEFLYGDLKLGSVFILGFTQHIFRDELLKYPEFGFISRDELDRLNKLKKQAYAGHTNEIEQLKHMNIRLKKRLHNRKGNGFFTFMGYKELTNRLFIGEENTKLAALSDDELRDRIDSGKIKINKDLLATFANSLLICDEIHNVYNSLEKNNWGVTIQTILNHHKSCRAIFLSATPINNSPTESIDLLNLLLPRQHYPMLTKTEFFEGEKLRPEKEKTLEKLFMGRLSYIRNRNPKYMATKIFAGEAIRGIPYLKFIRCPMSNFHYKIYKEALSVSDTLGQDGQYLMDFVLPDPGEKPYTRGIFRAKDIRERLGAADPKWVNAMGITYEPKRDMIHGTALHEGETLGKISAKYQQMLKTLLQNIKNRTGKIFIYHNNIIMSGVLFIQEILYQNGIIGEFDNSVDNTLCMVCGEIRKAHSKAQLGPISGDETVSHFFTPARFVIMHSNLEKKQMLQSLEKFNHVNNIDGSKYLILVGSRIIKESYTMNSVRQIYIMSRPDNIPTLIQIIGRAVRLNSHRKLKYDQRNVTINIFTSAVPGLKELSIEEKRYADKVAVYQVIQRIEQIMHETAIDGFLNYDKIWDASSEDKNFALSILPYKKPNLKTLALHELNLSTFNAYHAKFEVSYIQYMIKRLFLEYSSAWKYPELLAAVQAPPFAVEINPRLISRDLFNIALNNLVYAESLNYAEPKIKHVNEQTLNLMDKVRNPDDKIFLENPGEPKFVLTQLGEFYLLAPLISDEIYNVAEIVYRPMYKVKPRLVEIVDYLRHDMKTNYQKKKLKFIKKWDMISINHLEMAICDFGIKFHQEFIEEIIEYVFKIWTDPTIHKSEYHNFFIKMLYYYDLQKLVSWAHFVSEAIQKKYKKYILPVTTKPYNKKLLDQLNIKDKSSGFINLLVSSINRNDPNWISTGMIKEYENKLKITNHLFDGIYKKSKHVKKINADLLPVGHFLTKIPRFYTPEEGWRDDPTYATVDKTIKENSIIIGYDTRSKTGLSVKFKLRSPMQNIRQYRDSRLIEKGTICTTKSKGFLSDIAKKLGIENIEANVDSLCQQIRAKLMYNELKARASEKPERWFYFVHENIELS